MPASAGPDGQGPALFVDSVTGRHVAPDPQSILDRRGLQFRHDYGWVYDAVADPKTFSMAGANGRFSLYGLGEKSMRSAASGVKQLETAVRHQIQQK
eukprot:gene20790-27617_t